MIAALSPASVNYSVSACNLHNLRANVYSLFSDLPTRLFEGNLEHLAIC